MRTGKVTSDGGHGRVALANGTAYNMINAYYGSSGGGVGRVTVSGSVYKNSSGKSTKKSSDSKSDPKSKSNSNKDAEETKETFDWIERKIKDIERDIENLDQTASATYKSWTTRNKALVSEMSKITKEISVQQAAYDRYIKEANSVGLSKKYKNLVKNGAIDISTIKDEDLIDKIQTYQDFYDKAISANDAVKDLQDQLAELARTKFDNVAQQYEDKISTVEHNINILEGKIDQIEAKGSIPTRKYYDSLIAQEKKNISLLKKEYSALQKQLANSMKTGDIKKYSEEWYSMQQEIQGVEESILDANTAIAEYKNSIKEIAVERFDKVVEKYENKLSDIEHQISVLEAYADQVETSGHAVSSKYYDALATQEKKNISMLEKEYTALQKQIVTAMKTGDIKEGSEEWYEMHQEINGVQEALIEANTALIEYQNSSRQVKWDAFDRLQEKISKITEESEFLISLMENSDLYDDKGQLTDTGMATMGLHAQNYNVYMNQADQYAKEIKSINKKLAKDPSNLDLIERYEELIELQQESILSAEDEKNAIKDLVEEGINVELEALQDLIEKYNESLDSAKNLFDYQKNIEDQTKEIATLQKQLAAYQGDTSEENKAKIQQIKVSLDEAQDNLDETEYEHYISEQQKILDDLYDDYETILNERLDNIDALLTDMISTVNENASDINKTIKEEAKDVGYTLSENMKDIWSNEGSATKIITTYGNSFTSKLTSVNNVLNNIASTLDSYVQESNKEADDTVKSTTTSSSSSSKATSTSSTKSSASSSTTSSSSTKKTTTTPTTTTTKKTTSTTKTIKVGGKINAGNAKIYGYAGDKTGSAQYYKNDPIYTVLEEKNGYLKVRHHKLKSGVSGWFKKSDVKAYKTGGLIDYDGLAAVHGGKKPELVLNSKDTENFIDLKDTLRRLTKEDSVLFSEDWVDKANSLISNISPSFGSLTSNTPNIVPSNTNQNMNNTFYMTFELHDVTNGEDVVNYLIKSDRFENAVKAMTVDRLAGGSKFSKNKYYKNA